MWSGGSEKWLLCKKKNLIILEYALLLHFVWSGGSEKELLCEKKKGRQNKTLSFQLIQQFIKKKKNCFHEKL